MFDPATRVETVAAVAKRSEHWLHRYSLLLVFLDAALLAVAGVVAVVGRDGTAVPADDGYLSSELVSAELVVALIACLWLCVLALNRCYETRFLAEGPEEYRRVGNAALKVVAVVAFAAYVVQLPLAAELGAPFVLLATVLLLAGRYLARAVLSVGRRGGRWAHRVVVVGNRAQAIELATHLARAPRSGYVVVGAVVPGGDETPLQLNPDTQVPVAGRLARLSTALVTGSADTVAVAASQDVTPEGLRVVAYELEGTGVDLLVAPALTNMAGSRVTTRPVAGLGLLHFDEPELSGARRFVKYLFDLVVAGLLVVVLAVVLVVLALAIRLTSPGPALFRQERVGLGGRGFCVYKFRTMSVDAEQRLAELAHLNEHDGVLFKLRADPRITRLGGVLRKYSLDELPQLFNVLRGDMSLVGPRPPLRSEVARYEGHTSRRLLVKPGITGLWQVSGRSDLSWDDSVRLDLQYVENWSLGLDISILARTALAVLAGRGAY